MGPSIFVNEKNRESRLSELSERTPGATMPHELEFVVVLTKGELFSSWFLF